MGGWSRKWQPNPVFLPGKFHGQRNLVGYSPWGRKESNTAEQLHFTSVTSAFRPYLKLEPAAMKVLCQDFSFIYYDLTYPEKAVRDGPCRDS